MSKWLPFPCMLFLCANMCVVGWGGWGGYQYINMCVGGGEEGEGVINQCRLHP